MNEDFSRALLDFGILFGQLSGKMLEAVRPENLTPIQFEILQIIESGKRVTVSELCACTKLSMPNASREIRRLHEKSLILKEDDTEDKRKTWICLSESGINLMAEVYGTLAQSFMARYGHLAPEEIEEMTRCLKYLQIRL